MQKEEKLFRWYFSKLLCFMHCIYALMTLFTAKREMKIKSDVNHCVNFMKHAKQTGTLRSAHNAQRKSTIKKRLCGGNCLIVAAVPQGFPIVVCKCHGNKWERTIEAISLWMWTTGGFTETPHTVMYKSHFSVGGCRDCFVIISPTKTIIKL